MKTKGIALALFVLFALSFMAMPIKAYDTENVIVVVIDGLRNEEAFDDSTHQYIPYMWNELRPLGTIYTEFYNDFLATYTTPAHTAMITGQWHWQPNLFEQGYVDIRPEAPTMFEYYRKHYSLPQATTMVVTGKSNLVQLDWGYEPSYGADFGSLMYKGASDDVTYNLLQQKLAEHHPSLVLVNLQDVDAMGHTNIWADYITAIENADHFVYRIWTELIQGDAFYQDKTTLIVTSDHGRNDDSVGFKDHAGISHQNRHVLFLALGPDTPAGRVVTERRYLIDICPTAGELLGFPTPYSHGQVITGIFDDGLNPDARVRVYQKNPRICNYNGAVFVTWSENEPTDMGNERIYLKRKMPGQQSFGAPILISNPAAARWAFRPSVTANIQGLHVAWLDGRALDGMNDTWSIFYRVSYDWGDTWEDEKLIVTSVFEWEGPDAAIVCEPELVSSQAGELVIYVRMKRKASERAITSFRSTNGGLNWGEYTIREGNVFPRQLSPISLTKASEAAMVWIEQAPTPGAPEKNNWEIGFMRTVNGGNSWNTTRRLSNNTDYSDCPKLAWNGQKLLCVWSDLDVLGSLWKLSIRTSNDKGRNWTPVEAIPNAASAWRPSVVWDSTAGEFTMVWVDYDQPVPDVKMSWSAGGSGWAPAVPVMQNPKNALRRDPQIGYDSGSIHIVWEEYDPMTTAWSIESTSTPSR